MENVIIIPFVIGYGKTGQAKQGLKHAMIKDTLTYSQPMSDYRNCMLRNMQPQDDKEKVLSMANKYFFFDALLIENKSVFIFYMPNKEVIIFFNYDTTFPPHSNSVILESGNRKITIKR